MCSSEGTSLNGRQNRGQQQPVIVTSISGSTIGISPGIRMPNISSGKSPQAWWDNGLPIQGDGIEDLSIDHRHNDSIAITISSAMSWEHRRITTTTRPRRQAQEIVRPQFMLLGGAEIARAVHFPMTTWCKRRSCAGAITIQSITRSDVWPPRCRVGWPNMQIPCLPTKHSLYRYIFQQSRVGGAPRPGLPSAQT